jgi:hypothetical protein
MSDIVIEAVDFQKMYGKFIAVDRISFQVIIIALLKREYLLGEGGRIR